jgi:intein/homing endonuclease
VQLGDIKPDMTVLVYKYPNYDYASKTTKLTLNIRPLGGKAFCGKLPDKLSLDLARLFGYFLSEGYYSSREVAIFNSDKDIIDDIVSIYQREFGITVIPHKNRNVWSARVGKKIVIEFFKQLELCGKSGDKRIGDCLLGSPKNIMRQLLLSYFEGDGGVERGKGVSATSKSQKLLKDIQVILLTFGVESVLTSSKKYASNTANKVKRTYFKLSIYGKNCFAFRESIGFISERKKYQLNDMCNGFLSMSENKHASAIPIIKDIIKELKQKLPISGNGNLIVAGINLGKYKYPPQIRNTGCRLNASFLPALFLYLSQITKALRCKINKSVFKEFDDVIKILDDFKDRYSFLLDDNLIFSKVRSIESQEADVYDICKDGEDKSFITNGITSHNTTLCRAMQAWSFCNDVTEWEMIYDKNGDMLLSHKKDNSLLGNPEDFDFFVDYYEHNCRMFNFADVFKKFLIEVMGLRKEQCYGTDRQKNTFTKYKWENLPESVCLSYETCRGRYLTGREMMQIFATDVMRKMFSDTIWIDATMNAIKIANPKIAFVADTRFTSEVKTIMSQPNSYMIRLTRRPFNDVHSSETQLDDFDFSRYGKRALVIDNSSMTVKEQNDIGIKFFAKILKQHNLSK